MRYCNQCHRLTGGEPTFCNYCGRSYDLKLCPQRHPNPRSAEVCSQCGSRELSMPQPRVSFWLAPLLALLSVLPGAVLLLVSALFLLALLNALLNNQQALLQLMVAGVVIGFLWRLYLLLPGFLRRALSKLPGRGSRKGGERGR